MKAGYLSASGRRHRDYISYYSSSYSVNILISLSSNSYPLASSARHQFEETAFHFTLSTKPPLERLTYRRYYIALLYWLDWPWLL
uniref:Uncharacterized protein n=1 Tax=Utricularia reniformis TaxID=192314 RepID=A0A1Y0B1K5_9LAMI|nr:hypothetical protein AEK19_MT1113 [Utricularia reniformis]ART31332.1 hypothetical protein AEK19_MT1113 [Utricularia reniformis]